MSAKHTFGHDFTSEEQSYHASIIRNQLTRSLPAYFEDLCDEISLALNDTLPSPEKEGGAYLKLVIHTFVA